MTNPLCLAIIPSEMAIKIRLPNNIVIEADNQFELRAVLAILGYPDGAGLTAQDKPPKEQSVLDRLRKLWDRLGSENQRVALAALAANPEGLKDDDLRQAILLKGKSELAGVLGGLAKNATALGLSYEKVLIKQVVGDAYEYRLTPEARDVAGEQGWSRKLPL